MGVPGSPFSAIHPMSPAALYSADFSNPMFAQSGLLNAIVASARMAGPGEFANGGFGGQGNGVHPVQRCLYIGNLPEDTTTTDICEAVRGGLLLSVKYIADKHYAVSGRVLRFVLGLICFQFVTFADPIQATHFYHQATSYGLMIKQKKVKVSWGRGNNFVHPSLMNAVMAGGATRIVYIGGVEDFELFNEQRLREDFEPFGGEYAFAAMVTQLMDPLVEIEQVNFLKDKKAAFVNLWVGFPSAVQVSDRLPSTHSCDVRHASKALESIKTKPEYENLRLAYGKDRCANNPRPGYVILGDLRRFLG
jgi:hypothetical protein